MAEVAEELGVSRTSIYRRIEEMQLPASKPGGLWRIARSDLEMFMEQRKYDPLKGTWLAEREREALR